MHPNEIMRTVRALGKYPTFRLQLPKETGDIFAEGKYDARSDPMRGIRAAWVSERRLSPTSRASCRSYAYTRPGMLGIFDPRRRAQKRDLFAAVPVRLV